jgi:formylglycine-generating enzyme required for sulfatase activity/mono/diheme cytochrome c family protein
MSALGEWGGAMPGLCRRALETIVLWLAPVVALCAPAVDFDRQVRPILATHCIACHGPDKTAAGLRLDLKPAAVVPGQPEKSPLYTSVELPPARPGAMPPGGPQLSKEDREIIRRWISEGAPWPPGAVIRTTETAGHDEQALVEQIYQKIAANPASPEIKPYKTTIPGTDVTYEMVPIPGGEFLMGTSGSEPGHKPDEAPQHRVRIEPFWMGSHEVTWDEYRLFMFARQGSQAAADKDAVVDAVTHPTRPYVEMSFGMGINGYPAISMTQHAANKYAEWLSARTGQFYRLPTEAEWEYACRAGTTTAYSFGDDVSKLGDYAWYTGNSDGTYHKVGTKQPNPWGLYDMEGNVMEWTLDQYDPNFYQRLAGKTSVEPWDKATKPYPHVARGGSWNDPPTQLRCGARMASDRSWKMQDPQMPKSIWYLTDAQWLGFRLIRPVKAPSAKEMYQYWNSGVEKE